MTRVAAGTFADQLERQVTLPDDPQRVISLATSITEIGCALAQESRLQGVTRYSDFPSEATKLPKIGSYVRLDLERIVALNPDLCIAIKDGYPKEVIDRLGSLKIPVYAAYHYLAHPVAPCPFGRLGGSNAFFRRPCFSGIA